VSVIGAPWNRSSVVRLTPNLTADQFRMVSSGTTDDFRELTARGFNADMKSIGVQRYPRKTPDGTE
jgi:hypothetical protein